ncbi:MAG: RNA polymerase sigma factor [Armatimonas sp.]
MSREDARLVRALQRGDSAAFAQVVDAYGPKVLALARRYTRCEADAEDLTQEVFVALSTSLPKFRGEAALSTFLYRIAMNHCLKHVQRRKPEGVPLEDSPLVAPESGSPEKSAERAELRVRLESAIARLSSDHRDIVLLHEMHGLTYAECADTLGIPLGTVKSRLFHAFKNLRGLLGEAL